MYKSHSEFKSNIQSSRDLSTLYTYLTDNVKSGYSFEDVLRFQVVSAVSAIDKLIHDLIRVGMLDIFNGKRQQTPKYLNESISLSLLHELDSATIPPREYYFEKYLVQKLGQMAFQSPDKISDGLSFIWNEKEKWKKISSRIGQEQDSVKTTLRLIVDQRNRIVHEADVDLSSGAKFQISKVDCDFNVNFIESCGTAIFELVV